MRQFIFSTQKNETDNIHGITFTLSFIIKGENYTEYTQPKCISSTVQRVIVFLHVECSSALYLREGSMLNRSNKKNLSKFHLNAVKNVFADLTLSFD